MGTIIKAGQLGIESNGIRGEEFNFSDLTGNANDYLGQVRTQAAQIISQAKQQAESIKQQAQIDGRQAALQEAQTALRQVLEQQLQTLLPALQQSIHSIQESKQVWLKNWEQRAVHLATEIAARIVRRELSAKPEIAVDLVKEMLELAVGHSQIKLFLNPSDIETLGNQIDTIVAEMESLSPSDIIPDPTITAGGCRLETEFGEIDGQLESQFARIEEELT